MLRPARLPIAFLFAFSTFINFSFAYKEYTASHKASIVSTFNDSLIYYRSFVPKETIKEKACDAYTLMDLEEKGLSKKVFDLAMKGYNKLIKRRLVRNKNFITIADFSNL